jgi:hypothetical protein
MITLKKNPEQVELIKAMGSKNKIESLAAQEAFAAAIGPVVSEVLMHLGTAPLFFKDWEFGEDESPTYPLDFLYGEGAGAISIWYANKAGGLPSNQIEGSGEVRFMTYNLESAVNFDKKYARKTTAFSVLSKAVERMLNEITIKTDRQAWATVLRALGEARSKQIGGTNADHIITSTAQNVLQLDDFNRLLTLYKRINQSYSNGSVSAPVTSLTDIFISPELKEQIRGFAYNPMNTRTVEGTAGTPAGSSTAMPLPDSVREEIYRSVGASSIFGVNITDLNELGLTCKYNQLFSQFAPASIAHGSQTFDAADDEIVIALDANRGAFVRAIETSEMGTASVLVDDQFLVRSEKVGFYTRLNEGRAALDGRAIAGLVV